MGAPRCTFIVVEPDILGPPYERRTIDLGSDDEGRVVATLVRRKAAAPTTRAVLYVHGYNDYFFQDHVASFYVEKGYDFYALDLRKYGRSLLPHQTANYVTRISGYFPELDEAARIIRDEEDHNHLLINAHSTGGLITALWAHRVRDAGIVDGMFLNSPFFEFNVPVRVRRTMGPMYGVIGRVRPYARVPAGASTVYGHSIHIEHFGEWQFDKALKPMVGFTPRAAWLTAIIDAQARLHAGLNIQAPILVGCSLRSYKSTKWSEEARTADTVLDVEHIARWAPALGQHVTVVRFKGGLHDLALSGAPVRKQVFAEIDRWLATYVADRPVVADRGPLTEKIVAD
jgi:alpha-beta hydrolase superfamily lysophospholipase